MRKLASIQEIKEINPIEGADSIEVATILGWKVVIQKGQVSVGDKVVYVEIDSVLPDKPEFEFIKKRSLRIKTIRLRGQVSQGICFPLSIIPNDFIPELDADCTEVLGITKYEPTIPACLSGKVKGFFPPFIPKTDETRVQVLQKLLDKYKGQRFYITEKLDGSSATFYIKDGEFGVCSRNLELLEDEENSFWKVAREYDIENKLRSLGINIAIQGELVGEGIQGNKLKIRGQKVYFFNAFDIDNFYYLSLTEFISLFTADLKLPLVPIIEWNYDLENDIEAIIKRATIKSEICSDAWSEGIVIRPHKENIDLILSNEKSHNGRVSFKAINPEFLLKYGE
jgi:RNA ligase (TIGR02306 family)